MARRPRLVVPGYPHHVTQRGARRQPTFFSEEDCAAYLDLLLQAKAKAGITIWAYCLMPNHVHLILVPSDSECLTRAVSELHRRYTRRVNRREGWTGCLWQGRYFSFPMDERHLISAVKYVLLNPVRAGLVEQPVDWPYSSCRCHLHGDRDPVVDPAPLARRISDWPCLLSSGLSDSEAEKLRLHQRTGRPLGDQEFLGRLGELEAQA